MINKFKTFENSEFGKVRTIIINEEPWFSGKDIAKCLGYIKPNKAILDNVKEEETIKFSKDEVQECLVNTLEDFGDINNKGMRLINESGVYSLIFNSKSPKAKEFKKWITSEVLKTLEFSKQYRVLLDKLEAKELARLKEEKEHKS